MPLKYKAGIPEAVKFTGWIHGVLFVAYVYLVYMAAQERKWPISRSIQAFIAALLPFGTFIFDRSLKAEITKTEQSQ